MMNSELASMRRVDNNFHEQYPDPTPEQYQQYDTDRLAEWKNVVSKYESRSLYEVLNGFTGAEAWSSDQIQLLGTVGIGTGGIGSIMSCSPSIISTVLIRPQSMIITSRHYCAPCNGSQNEIPTST